MNLLKCEAITKIYGTGPSKVIAVNEINLAVEKGEFVAITGASGSGKSTLLHMIGAVDTPDSGKIIVEDTDISLLNTDQLAVFRRRKVGLIYQFYNLIPTLSIRRNILFPMLLDKRKPEKDYFNRVVDTLGISDLLDRLPSELSGGQQQRVAIARSLLYKPALLLADEPTGNLDQKNSREIIDLLKQSNQNFNQSILLVTHDERIANEASRIITMEDGSIVSDKVVTR